jgi:hypothetical protein
LPVACRSPAMMPARRPPPAPAPRPSDKLHELARHVLRLGQRGWSNPETFIIAKETIAAELRQVARELGE